MRALALLALMGCPEKPETDTADSGCAGAECDGEEPVAPFLKAVLYDCDADACTWILESDGTIGAASLDIIDNGNTSWDDAECGDPDTPHAKDRQCGVWHEYHDDFARTVFDNAWGGDTFELSLDVLTEDECGAECWSEQRSNVSTLFDLGDVATLPNLTVRAVLYDVDGNYSDCGAAGFAPEYYGNSCENDLGPL